MLLVLNGSEPHISPFFCMSVLIGRSNIRVTPWVWWGFWGWLFNLGVFFESGIVELLSFTPIFRKKNPV